MVVIDQQTGKCYENLKQIQVASLLGVCRQTVSNWQKKHKVFEKNNYKIYLFAKKFD